MENLKFYPAYLDLDKVKVVVVGSGSVARRKISLLGAAGACVCVVSPSGLKDFAVAGTWNIEVFTKEYESSDLEGCFLAIAATDNLELNRQIAVDARQRGMLVNVVAPPEESNFVVPSVIARGSLIISVSTSGKSPALSKKIRKELDLKFGDEYEIWIEILGRVRTLLHENIKTDSERAQILDKLVNSNIITILKDGKLAEAEEAISKTVGFKIALAFI